MRGKDTIEFYDGETMVACVPSSMVPPVGSLVNIRKQTWQVERVTYALDHADEYQETAMRACVDIKRRGVRH